MTICLSREGSWRLWTVLLRELCALMWDLTSAFSNLQCLCIVHCASVCPRCVSVCPCARTQPDPPMWATKINKMGNIANATTTQKSDVTLVELLLSTAQRVPCSLPSPTVTSSSTSSVNISAYRTACDRRLTLCTRSAVCWEPCSCRS